MPSGARPHADLRLSEPAGRWVLLATVLGSGLALLDATVVNVALGRIGADLDADLGGLQWTLNGYTLALAALILLGGSLSDGLGRRRIFVIGTAWFALASALCALAPSIEVLVAARALQGVGGALLTPGSLAILAASFAPEERSRAIGAWSGLGGVAAAVGPFLGGWLIDLWSWRLVFLINLPAAAVVVGVSLRHVPESRDPGASGSLDVSGTVLGALALGGLTYASIAAGGQGWTPLVTGCAVAGGLAVVLFVVHLRRALAELGRDCARRGVALVGISSNDVGTHPDDRPERMAEHARTSGWTFPYLYDESQEVARAYRAACTPDFFLFGSDRRLVYRGQFDDSRPGNGRPITGADLRGALDALMSGAPISSRQVPSMGCNIKWKPGNEPDYFRV